MLFAMLVPQKGYHDSVIDWLESTLRLLGRKKFIFKSDSEPSLMSLKTAVIERLTGIEIIPKETPRGDWKGHGEIEVAIRDIRRQARVLRASLEQKLMSRISMDHSLLAWLVGHAAFLLSRIPIGKDGRTAVERWTGRTYRREIAIFGEHVLWKTVLKKDSDKKVLIRNSSSTESL